MKKRLLSLVMVAAMLFGSAAALPEGVFDDGTGIVASAASTATSGKCGEDVFWSLKDGVLTISGTGSMNKYTSSSATPFCYRTDIKTVVIGEGITNITDYLFFGCESLKSITIPDSVISINFGAFWNCSSLESITIPDSVTEIGSWAFFGCTRLKELTISNSVEEIEQGAFSSCKELKDIFIPDSVTKIGDYAFSDCTSLLKVRIPNGIISLDNSVFSNCKSLNNVIIPDSVKYINNYTFSGCTSLTSIIIPKKNTRLGNGAFSSCTNLISITIPSSVTKIYDNAFDGCDQLTINCYKYSYAEQYAKEKGFNYNILSFVFSQIDDNTVEITKYVGLGGAVSIPSTIDGKIVTSIGSAAFKDCTSLSYITIPDCVTSIDDDAFSGCTKLTSITIPDSIKSIGNNAFNGCSSLNSITIPNTLNIIEDGTFSDCTSLNSVNIPQSVTSIGKEAFKNTGLISVTIPYGLTSIKSSAFYHCRSLTDVYIPSSVSEIGSDAFKCCPLLKTVTLPQTVSNISSKAFGYDSSAKIAKFKIYCIEGSAAEEYAKDNGFDYEYYMCKHDYASIIVDPTCTEKGYTKNLCKHCGNLIINKNSYVDALDHDYSDIKVIAPTCTEKGYTLNTCIRCGDEKKTDYVNALGHNLIYTVTPPNCSERGYTTRSCSRCDYSYKNTYTDIDANAHVYDNWITTFESTDTICGTKERLCKLCKHRDVLIDHDKEYVKTVAPTCTEKGYDIYNCKRCGEELNENYVDATGHDWKDSEWIWNGDSNAKLKFICQNDNSHVQYVDAKVTQKTKSPTCTNSGTLDLTATASFEGKTYTDYQTKTLNSTGHNWGEPTWKWDGNKAYATFVCSKNSTHTQTLSAYVVTDNIKPATCTSSGTAKYTATIHHDGKGYTDTYTATLQSAGHTFETTVVYPTMYEGGYTTYKCSVCGYSYKSDYTNAATSGKCGDNLTWTFNNGTLTISGTGDMYNWEFGKEVAPMISTKVTSIVIGSGVTSIGDWAFTGCTKAKSVSIPASVKKIGEGAFQNCSGLTKVTIPNGITSIEAGAFAMCFGLASVSIPSSVRSIDAGAFMGCSSLKSISIPSGVTTIEDDAFALCDILTTISIPSTVNFIGDGAFRDTPWLTNMRKKNPLVVVNGILVDAQTYKGSSLTLSSSIKGICGSAFSECNNLISITIPSSITSIGNDAFYNCKKLKSIVIPNSVQSIEDFTFYSCTSLSSVTIGNGVKSIGYQAFYDTPNLKSIIIPASVGTIDKYAFGYYYDSKTRNSVKVSGFTINGYAGSAAETYAKENGFNFVKLNALNGWNKLNTGKWIYCKGGGNVIGWKMINNKWYYFNAGGIMQIGWQMINNKWYFFNTSGAMVTGWQKLGGKWYFFNSSGAMVTGWQKLGNTWYFFNSSGAMVTGWQKLSNKWYYFNTSGAMVNGWQKISNKWYYFESSGAMLANTSRKIGGKTYKFNASGVCTNP